MRWFVEIGASQDECKVSRCSDHGLVIRFPFQLKDQPYRCGYPGFEISCIEKKQIILQLPSVSLSVKKINYNSQEIIVHDPDFCLQRQLQNLTLSASPFHFKLTISNYLVDYTFFNCSSNKTDNSNYFLSIPCIVLLSNPDYAVGSYHNLERLDLSSCHKIYNVIPPQDIVKGENYFSLTWSEMICGNCEREGKQCRLKSNVGKEPETECIDKRAKGTI